MDIRKEDLPVILQAFEIQGNNEVFVAEQLVSNQADVDQFTTIYAGKIIKASKEVIRNKNNNAAFVGKKKNSTTSFVVITIILILLALVIYGFYTGWIQQKFNINT